MKYLENRKPPADQQNLLQKEFQLATYVATSITLLVLFSTLTISAALYFSLNKSLSLEFENRVKAQGREIEQLLNNRFIRLENRLRALSLDNTIRVTLMLGAHNQLADHLQYVYNNDGDLRYFITQAGTELVFSPSSLRQSSAEILELLRQKMEKPRLDRDILDTGFSMKYTLPIHRQKEKIGTALVIYQFDRDKYLQSILEKNDAGKILWKEGTKLWNLLTGEAVAISEKYTIAQDSGNVQYITVAEEKYAAVKTPELEGTYFLTSIKSLEAAQSKVLINVLIPAVIIMVITLIVSLLLSRRLTHPLKQISDLATSITLGSPSHTGRIQSTRIVEFNKLELSLLSMLNYLQQAREMEKYQELFEGVADLVFLHSTDGRIVDANTVALKRLGFSKKTLIQKSLRELATPTTVGQIDKMFSDLQEKEEYSFFNTEIVDFSGKTIFTECHARRISYGGEPFILNVVRDISERRRAESALQVSHQTLLTVLNSIEAQINVCDPETGEILFMNKYAAEIFGSNSTDRKCFELFCGQKDPCRKCSSAVLLREKENFNKVISWEGKNPITGQWFNNYDRIVNWIDGRRVKFQIAFDISDKKELEFKQEHTKSQMRKVQKMEAVATLAGGVAHDLNNILTGIVSYPDLMLMQLPPDSPLRSPLMTMKETGMKASAIVQDLLTLARRGVVVNEVVNLNSIITDYLESPEHRELMSNHHEIAVSVDLQNGLHNILGSSLHLSKTLMNLVTNSAEAIQKKGTISIRTSIELLHPGQHERIKEGEYVVLLIRDDGSGISPENRDRIFEPFFTTKVMGRSGTGLGMAVVWGTIEDHEGYIDLDTNPGKGATFKLYFPVTRKKLLEEQQVLSRHDYNGRGESILVIDDVPEQRDIAIMMFSQLGYNVNSVASGEMALEYLKKHTADLILLDMIMEGGMDGLETYKRILKIHPGQKAIITTGYSETEAVKEVLRLGAGQYVKKPYLFEEIAQAIQTELKKDNGRSSRGSYFVH